MSSVVSSFIPFPNIYWWLLVADVDYLTFDCAEHFQKMSYRNRYYISGANGLIPLSIPLVAGRNQRCAMKEVQISYAEDWQVQHWRTIVSVYSRTPYFHYYEPGLKKLFDTKFTFLHEFDLASVQWLAQQLKLKPDIRMADSYIDKYEDDVCDLRFSLNPGIEKTIQEPAPYYQVFADRTGFFPNLSMPDLLFCEGPHTMNWIKENTKLIKEWGQTWR